MADVTLSGAIRSNLLSLQGTSRLTDRTNNRLSTGLKVASAIDDAVAYFQAKSLNDRATDLSGRKDTIDQGISTVKASINALESVEKILNQMKGIALSAKSADTDERKELSTQFAELAQQLNYLVEDASYQGLNLVNSTTAKLTVEFSDKSTSKLDISGANVKVSALMTKAGKASAAASGLAGASWDKTTVKASTFNSVVKALEDAITSVRTETKKLGNNVALLQTRLDFTNNYTNTLTEGASKLTLADLNEEGANLVALQTRQQLGVQALAFAGQQESAVLQLFG